MTGITMGHVQSAAKLQERVDALKWQVEELEAKLRVAEQEYKWGLETYTRDNDALNEMKTHLGVEVSA